MGFATALFPFARFDATSDPSFEYVQGAAPTDGLAAAGLYPQNDSTPDMLAGVERDAGGNLVLKDAITGAKTLAQLSASSSGISEETHKTLRQLIHFIDGGPAEGFASGAYREVTGTVFPTAIIWWESAAKLKKVVEKTLAYTGAFPTTVVWKVYAADGVTVLATVTDTITYSGAFETSRTRDIA